MNKIKLSECEINKSYRICEVKEENKTILAQLKNLGFTNNEKVVLLKSNYRKKSFLVKIMGINYAIDKLICDKILVYYE